MNKKLILVQCISPISAKELTVSFLMFHMVRQSSNDWMSTELK